MTAASRAASVSAVAALVLAAAWFFWPSALGGGTTYLGTHGVSMEPGFHTGDLAILRPADGYSVGDVVAYYSPALDTIVMHRIVDGDEAGFVTQGDNNDWLDPEKPSEDEILGRLSVRVPRGGIALDAIRSPGALVFVVGGLLTVFGTAYRPRGRHKARSPRRRTPPRPPAFSRSARSVARQVAVGSGAVALVALMGGGVLLVLPSTQTGTRTVQVHQQGQFSYTGAAQPGTTYPSGVIATGDTVWTRLAQSVSVTFANTVTGPELAGVHGTMRLDVTVVAADGWTAVVDSGPETDLGSGTTAASVTVDPAAALGLLSRHYAEIGGSAGGGRLTVTPVVSLAGTAEGHRFTAGSPAGFTFTLDPASLKPTGDGLSPSLPTPVEIEEVVPRRLPVLGLFIPIDVARWTVAGVVVAALLVLGVSGWIGRTRRGDAADQFLVRHADRILPVAAFTPGPTVIDVSDAESLRRVAERFDTLVLHHAADDEDVFVVRDVDATYRLVIPGTPERRRGKPPVPGQPPTLTERPHVSEPAHVLEPASVLEQVEVPDPVPAAEPADSTAPLPLIAREPADPTGPMPLVTALPRYESGALWGRVA
jgi:signal peptidase I